MPPSETKAAVQRTARGLERAINAADHTGVESSFSQEFAERDSELKPLLEAASSAELIGTVATRTLLRLDTGEVVELLWRDYENTWLIFDCRVFTLLPEI
jgi:hypothetical protein